MKKSVLLVCIILSLLTLSLFSNFAHAATTPSSSQELISNQLGIDPASIPQSPEDIKDKYLNQEWGKIIDSTPIIGPVNIFLKTNDSALFVEYFLFAEAYTFTLTFILIFVFWLFAITLTSDLLRASGFLKGGVSLFVGLGVAVIIAQIGLLRFITSGIINFITRQENVWWRIVLWIIILVAIIAFYYLKKLIADYLLKARTEDQKASVERRVKKIEITEESQKKAEKL
ncbi:MAG: hypothetical protein WCK90_00025 [archaeon]